MNKSVNSGDNGYKSAECGERNDLTLGYIVNIYGVLKDLPRIVLGLLISERDFFALCVKVLNINFNTVDNRNNFRRIRASLPGKLGDVDHAVYAANVNKCTVACERLNCSCVGFANLDALKHLCCHFSLLCI